jgi:mRNA-degrading endonuclease RelE of RelBE toxin-antitoxin system
MKYTVEVKEIAKRNVADTFSYYESLQEGLGERFLSRFESMVSELQDNPILFQKKYHEFRQVLIKPFPYHIIYEVEKNKIVIYMIIYAERRPAKHYSKK